jgi:hypothetical protein
MPRRQRKPEVPRWRRGRQAAHGAVTLTGRDARRFARTYAQVAAAQAAQGNPAAGSNDVLARTGAWRHRRYFAPFIWLAVVLAAAVALRRTAHPLLFGIISPWVLGFLAISATRHLSRFARRTTDTAALVTAVWLPVLTGAGFQAPVPALLAVTWAVFAAVWTVHHQWRPAASTAPDEPGGHGSDEARWARLAKRQKWTGKLGAVEQIPGGRKYPILLDGAETDIGQVISKPRAIAAAYDKAQTEAYAEPDPSGVESRGYLTILRAGALEDVHDWDGHGIGADGIGRVGRFADGQPARIRLFVPRDGTRHGLAAGTSGAGKSALLDLLVWLALTSPVPIVPIILDPQNGQSLPQWRGKLLYAAGFDDCVRMIRGLHAAMLDRSRRLAAMTWTDDDGFKVKGMDFFDPALSGLPIFMPITDEAPVILGGDGNAKLAGQMVRLKGDAVKLGRKTGGSEWLVAQVPSLSELGDQALRSMLVGGNIICLRTGDKVSAGMLGLDADPSALPKYFPSGEPTGGLGYVVSVDNRQAPFRSDKVPAAMRRRPVKVPELEPEFLAILDYAMHGNLDAPSGAAAGPEPAPDPATDGAGEGPEGRTCLDAVWSVLSESGRPMERGDIIWAVNALADTWGRQPWVIRSITGALEKLTAGQVPGRRVTKPAGGKGGVYQAAQDRGRPPRSPA